jgi:hypothetical protein
MKIYRSQIRPNKSLDVDEDYSFSAEDCAGEYPLLEVKECHFKATFFDDEGILRAEYSVKGIYALSDSRTLAPFASPFEDSGVVDILSSVEEEGDGYIFPGTYFSSEELAHKIIKTLIPVSPHQDDSSLPESGEGYNVYSDDAPREKEPGSSPFDAIPDDFA